MGDHFRDIIKEYGLGKNGWKLRAYAEPSGVSFEVVNDVEKKMSSIEPEAAQALIAMTEAKRNR